jgi:hypothetical protein
MNLFKKIEFDLDTDAISAKVGFVNDFEIIDKSAVCVTWADADETDGVINVIGYLDKTETGFYAIIGTVNIAAASGSETIYTDVNCKEIAIQNAKGSNTTGTASVGVLISGKQ